MTTRRLSYCALGAALSLFAPLNAAAQCVNLSPYPNGSITADPGGLVTTIDPCNWQTEYGTITNVIAGGEYEFTMADGAWVTVRQGTSGGTVMGFGASPLAITAATGQDLFVHWNTDSLCGTAQDCHATTVRLLGAGCTPPEVDVEVMPDCANSEFSVSVQVLSTGDASTVGLSWTVDGGTPNNLTGLQTGTYALGPFANGSVIDVVAVHADLAICNVAVNDLTNEPCAIQGCGPDTYTHCYGNNENIVWSYQGTSSFPLQLQFNSGGVSASGNDALQIHDGLLPTDPLLFSGVGNGGNLAGITVLSTNPDHALTLTFTSNTSFSCADGGVTPPWNFTVGCLDCQLPAGTAGVVSTDCGTQQYSVAVAVTGLGSASGLEIANDAGVPATVVSETGQYEAGPFPVGTPVTLTLVNTESAICSIGLGTFENAFCPVQIECGAPSLPQSYCYDDSDLRTWLYQSSGTEPLAILFSGGSIESATYDHLTIHDGTDGTAPILYDHILPNTEQLAGLLVVSTGPALFMEMSSDNSVSCAGGGQTQWNWTVGCLDCEQPAATYSVELDCENSRFSIATVVTDLGSGDTLNITNTGGAPIIGITSTGTYMVGPFNLGADVQVSLITDNALCNMQSPVLTNAPCPLIGCGPFGFTYCYPNNMDTTIVYQSGSTYPISLLFNSGTIDTFGDHIEVYDGLDYQGNLLYNGSNGGDLSGLQFTSTNVDNALCVRFISDGFTSCSGGGGETPWNWNVSCLDCTNPAASFTLVEDCLHHGFNIEVDITDLGSASDLRITDSWSGDTLSGLGLGMTTIGTISVGQTANITVLNGSNPLCRIISQDFILAPSACVITACETIGVDYCYGDADTAWFVYQSGDNVPLSVSFAYGQLLDGDEIRIFNGLDDGAQLVFAGDLGGDLAGLALSSSNPDNALMFQIVSDGAGSCASGEATTPMYWTVGCGLVGQQEMIAAGLQAFPQPCNDLLTVRWPGMAASGVTVELFDLAGRCVLLDALNALPGGGGAINVGHLPPGGYALRVTTDQRVWSGPVLIQR